MDFRNIEAIVRRYTSDRCSYKFHNVHKKTPVLESLFNKCPGLKVCNFIKKRLQNRWFAVKFAKFFRTYFFTKHVRKLLLEISHELSHYCIWERWMVSFRGTYWLSSACFNLFNVLTFYGFYYFTVFKESLPMLNLKHWSCS